MKLRVEPRLDDQELSLDPVTCREGAVSVKGAAAGRPVTGLRDGELAGYSPKDSFVDIDF